MVFEWNTWHGRTSNLDLVFICNVALSFYTRWYTFFGCKWAMRFSTSATAGDGAVEVALPQWLIRLFDVFHDRQCVEQSSFSVSIYPLNRLLLCLFVASLQELLVFVLRNFSIKSIKKSINVMLVLYTMQVAVLPFSSFRSKILHTKDTFIALTANCPSQRLLCYQAFSCFHVARSWSNANCGIESGSAIWAGIVRDLISTFCPYLTQSEIRWDWSHL